MATHLAATAPCSWTRQQRRVVVGLTPLLPGAFVRARPPASCLCVHASWCAALYSCCCLPAAKPV
jgi:hypothetical protein